MFIAFQPLEPPEDKEGAPGIIHSLFLQSFSIQRITAISSGAISHLHKILDPNTPTATIHFPSLPAKQTPFVKSVPPGGGFFL